MKFFIDTADVEFVEDWCEFADGITTNPTLLSAEAQKTKRSFKDIITDICGFTEGPVSVEVAGEDFDTMLREAFVLAEISDNVCVKVPLTPDGLLVARALQDNDIMVNATLCFSIPQALLALQSGASFVSPFIGRLDDIGEDGIALIRSIRKVFDFKKETKTAILASSIRRLEHITEAALAGADAITLPPHLFEAMFSHPLTDKGLDQFAKDWAKLGQKIL